MSGRNIDAREAGRGAARPGLTAEQATTRLLRWTLEEIVPPPEREPRGRGLPRYAYPQETGAVLAVVSDLFDSGAIAGRDQLRDVWRFLSIPRDESDSPIITHILEEIEAGKTAWFVVAVWRHEIDGTFQKTCGVRFAGEEGEPMESPSFNHVAVGDWVIPLHRLLSRFATRASNVVDFPGARA